MIHRSFSCVYLSKDRHATTVSPNPKNTRSPKIWTLKIMCAFLRKVAAPRICGEARGSAEERTPLSIAFVHWEADVQHFRRKKRQGSSRSWRRSAAGVLTTVVKCWGLGRGRVGGCTVYGVCVYRFWLTPRWYVFLRFSIALVNILLTRVEEFVVCRGYSLCLLFTFCKSSQINIRII